MHKLPLLPFAANALQPLLSAETLEFHYGKHHRHYVDELNRLILGTRFAEMPLEDIVRSASGDLLHNAEQHYNHSLYWSCLAPPASHPHGVEPGAALRLELDKGWGSVQAFREAFASSAVKLFGSGWCWLVRKSDGSLYIEQTSNAGCPLLGGNVPLLTCDVWEHAYYIDYRNSRGRYIEAFWKIVNWDFVGQRATV